MLSALLAAVQTLTRIPVPSPRRPSDPTTIARSAVFYPLVGAAVNVLCRQYEIDPVVVDMGVNHTFDSSRAIVDRKIGFGTRNLLHEPAMNRREAVQSVETGVSLAEAAVKLDYGILAMGEMGIANTTPASAIVAVLARPLLSLDMRRRRWPWGCWRRPCVCIERWRLSNPRLCRREAHRPNGSDPLQFRHALTTPTPW